MRHFHLIRIVSGVTGLALVTLGCAGPAERSPKDAPRDIRLASDGQSIDAKVPAERHVRDPAQRHELPSTEVIELVARPWAVSSIRGSLRANQDYRITRTLDGLFREFRYQIDADRLLRVFARPAAADAGTLDG